MRRRCAADRPARAPRIPGARRMWIRHNICVLFRLYAADVVARAARIGRLFHCVLRCEKARDDVIPHRTIHSPTMSSSMCVIETSSAGREYKVRDMAQADFGYVRRSSRRVAWRRGRTDGDSKAREARGRGGGIARAIARVEAVCRARSRARWM